MNTIIVGAGITGLACAHFLAKKGVDFKVIEARNRIGGFIQTKHEQGYTVECGPNTVLMNDALEALIKDLGLWEDVVYPNKEIAANRYVIENGKLKKVPGSPGALLFSNFFTLGGRIRALREIFLSPLPNEDVDLETYLTKRFGKEAHDQLLAPVLRGIYAGDTKGLSAKHAIPSMWEMEKEHGSILKGLKKKQGGGTRRSIFVLKDGLQSMAERLVKPFEEKLQLNTKVTTVTKTAQGYTVRTEKDTFLAKHVIFTCGATETAQFVNEPTFTQLTNNIMYAPVASISLGFDASAIGMQVKGFGALKRPGDPLPFLGIIFNSHIFTHVAPEGKLLFKVMAGGTEDPALARASEEEIMGRVVPAVKGVLQATEDPEWTEITQWKKGIPQYNTQHDQLLEAVANIEKDQKGIHILGNFIKGVAIGDCIAKARDTAENIS